MDEQFPILERLYIFSRTEDDTTLVLPRTFQAPHLRHIRLWDAALPIGSPLLTSSAGLVSLKLDYTPIPYLPNLSTHPAYLLNQLSLVPQLEILVIEFHSPLPDWHVARQQLAALIMPHIHITLPNLHWFSFKGGSDYLEGIVGQISAPVLSTLHIMLSYSPVPLLQFIRTSEALRFRAIRLNFYNNSVRLTAPQPGIKRWFFSMRVKGIDLAWQVSSAIKIVDTLQPVLSAVKKLTLGHKLEYQSSFWDATVERTSWRQLLRPFPNLKVLRVDDALVGKLAPSLQTEDGESPLELLPNLKVVEYSGGDDARDAFTPFLDERRVAGHPVKLTIMVHDSTFGMR
jgi:hypothetical protein